MFSRLHSNKTWKPFIKILYKTFIVLSVRQNVYFYLKEIELKGLGVFAV